MEPASAVQSSSVVLIRAREGRRGSAAALVTLLLQLLFVGLAPAADARASATDAGPYSAVHIEKQGAHHHVHDSSNCAFCIALQAGAAPAPLNRPPADLPARRLPLGPETGQHYFPAPVLSSSARAPPVA